MHDVTELIEEKLSPVPQNPSGSLFSFLPKPSTKRGTRAGLEESSWLLEGAGPQGVALWRLNLKRSIFDAFTASPMLCTVLKQMVQGLPPPLSRR